MLEGETPSYYLHLVKHFGSLFYSHLSSEIQPIIYLNIKQFHNDIGIKIVQTNCHNDIGIKIVQTNCHNDIGIKIVQTTCHNDIGIKIVQTNCHNDKPIIYLNIKQFHNSKCCYAN
jgi:hypothetical protein